MKLIVIGIAGKAKVGKTTLAAALYDHIAHEVEEHNICAVLSLADVLKDECAIATGLPREWFDDVTYKETLRPLMQWWGTEFRRNPLLGGDNDYWVNRVKNRVSTWAADPALRSAYEPKSLVVVIPDVRFENEVDLVLSYENGIMVNLYAEGAEETTHSTHASEKGVALSRMTCAYMNDHNIGTTELQRIARDLYATRIAPVIS